jgi:L-cysteine:1D-myo-inositol 2-amino-2-deoxy-alpha-D-glucopyranoside ligase
MSKSLGNLVFVSDLLKAWDPMAVRLAVLDHDYHREWDWAEAHLAAAADRLDRWRSAGPGDGGLAEVRRALDDDLDLPRAVAAVDEAADAREGVADAAGLLGVSLEADRG